MAPFDSEIDFRPAHQTIPQFQCRPNGLLTAVSAFFCLASCPTARSALSYPLWSASPPYFSNCPPACLACSLAAPYPQPTAILELPTEADVQTRPEDQLPNAQYSSDHLAIMAEFQYKTRE